MNRFRSLRESRKTLSLFLMLSVVLVLPACGGGGSSGGGTAGQAVTLSFDPPSTYTDGTPITDFAGYILCYGPAPGSYTHFIDVGNVPTYTITLPAGNWYFSAKAYTLAGTESGFSNELPVTL